MTTVASLKKISRYMRGVRLTAAKADKDETLRVVEAWESLEDELSEELGLDPKEIRDILVNFFIGDEVPSQNQLPIGPPGTGRPLPET